MNNQNKIADIIIDFNPWWKEGYDIFYKPRLFHETLQKYLSLRQIIAITGLRRTGKTILMKKIISDILKQTDNAKAVFYFSFDEIKNIRVRDLVDTYANLTRLNIAKE